MNIHIAQTNHLYFTLLRGANETAQ